MADIGRKGADSFTYHGGDVSAAARAFPEAPKPWIDLSTGVNPRPFPIGPLDPASFARLPEPAAVAALEAAAARAYGAEPHATVAAPGTQALIQWLPRLFRAARVGILGPTYGEHERSWRHAGAAVETVDDVEALGGFDAAVVVNPNNPDGRTTPPDRLAGLAARLATHEGLLVVDEAFMDVLPPGASSVPDLPPRTVVLRSFGKAFGLAGLRLGFAVASPELAPVLRAAVGPWAVSGPAIAVGTRALDDGAWLAAATVRLRDDAVRLDTALTGAGATVLGGTPLFRLARFADGRETFEHLGRAGILVRPFARRPDLLRFGLPAGDDCWDRLERALSGQ